MSKTTIEWTEQTWNPVRGCSPVSPGCANCYAERQGGRFCGSGRPFDGFVQIGKNGNRGPHWTGKVDLIEHMLDIPLRTRKPTMWFVNSMSDLFHEGLSDEAIDRVFAVMALCPQHTFQVLTKRAKRMREYFGRQFVAGDVQIQANDLRAIYRVPFAGDTMLRKFPFTITPEEALEVSDVDRWPLSNVWLGVSVEDQQRKSRIDELRETPAAVRFLSVEPLLEDIGTLDLRGVGWVIVGGESGPGARPFDVAWARSIVRQCQSANVPVFVKQLGAHVIQGGERRIKKDKKGGDPVEWPEDLRIRQMPTAVQSPGRHQASTEGAQGGQ